MSPIFKRELLFPPTQKLLAHTQNLLQQRKNAKEIYLLKLFLFKNFNQKMQIINSLIIQVERCKLSILFQRGLVVKLFKILGRLLVLSSFFSLKNIEPDIVRLLRLLDLIEGLYVFQSIFGSFTCI
ncbi:Hypothetical_protein [Hexamita inflata]|uniref:Hypothetical_protein n=1 Tax=Hexamita inflata TaxID=28002 RepID=A0ABP1HPL0_9EUKA